MPSKTPKRDWTSYAEWTWCEYLVQKWGDGFTSCYRALGADHMTQIGEHKSLKTARKACVKHWRAEQRKAP